MSVSKYLEEKWRKGFRFFDVNKDGYVTKEDYEAIARYISERTGQIEEQQRSKTRHEWVKCMDVLLPFATDGKVDETGYIGALRGLYRDIENHKSVNIATYSTLFDNLDLNRDGLISYEELKIYYESHRVNDERFIRSVFHKLDTNKDGYIERDELITAGVNYWCSSVESDGYAFIYDPPK